VAQRGFSSHLENAVNALSRLSRTLDVGVCSYPRRQVRAVQFGDRLKISRLESIAIDWSNFWLMPIKKLLNCISVLLIDEWT